MAAAAVVEVMMMMVVVVESPSGNDRAGLGAGVEYLIWNVLDNKARVDLQ